MKVCAMALVAITASTFSGRTKAARMVRTVSKPWFSASTITSAVASMT